MSLAGVPRVDARRRAQSDNATSASQAVRLSGTQRHPPTGLRRCHFSFANHVLHPGNLPPERITDLHVRRFSGIIQAIMVRQFKLRFRLLRRRAQSFLIHNVLRTEDPPHRLALGVAIGVFVTFTPTIGIQMALNVFLAWILRANKVIGAPIVWITNPATLVPIYYPCYVLGRVILGHPPVRARWWYELAHPPDGWWDGVVFYWQRFTDIAAPLWVGCLLVATVLGYIAYYVSLRLICAYRMRRWGQLIRPAATNQTCGKGDRIANHADDGADSRTEDRGDGRTENCEGNRADICPAVASEASQAYVPVPAASPAVRASRMTRG